MNEGTAKLRAQSAALNDRLRARIGLGAITPHDHGGACLYLESLRMLSSRDLASAEEAVRSFDAFDESAPLGAEHLQGSIALDGIGTVCWWIDVHWPLMNSSPAELTHAPIQLRASPGAFRLITLALDADHPRFTDTH